MSPAGVSTLELRRTPIWAVVTVLRVWLGTFLPGPRPAYGEPEPSAGCFCSMSAAQIVGGRQMVPGLLPRGQQCNQDFPV